MNIEKEYHEDMNKILKKKLKKLEQKESIDLEENEKETEGKGVWQRVVQYFWGSNIGANQKPRIKRTMGIDDEDEEPEPKRKCTDGRKTPGLISVKRELAEMAIEDDQ
ncbi:hypothetical protein L5515_015433 [Caenorhabditis briggsae]|uniref:Uncharacterized protein n=1 Tax=Caenorhabditis briggsae TaxID=6238 RepID=A0AAE9J9Z8_CAEBR|nr:hypothetical protein L5515_015433 [Caenorhabditis briggsae]